MKEINDEILMAYADDVLGAEERSRVEAHLEADPELRDRVARMQSSAKLLREAYSPPMSEAPPQSMIDQILGADSGVVSLETKRRKRPAWHQFGPVPIAASVALMVGLGLGAWFVGPTDEAGPQLALGLVSQDSQLHQVLETRASGDSLRVNAEQALVSVLTFRDGTGRPCREVELVSAERSARPVALAIACRDGGGGWTVEGSVQIALDAAPKGDDGFAPVSGPAAKSLEAIIEALGAGPSLSPDDEAKLLEKGWH